MQQTDKYKLNKPGVDDPIAIATLNENMDKVEGALAMLDETAAGHEARIAALEVKKLAVGHYHGDDAPSRTIEVGFTPLAVLIHVTNSSHSMYGSISLLDIDGEHKTSREFTVVENGFTVYKSDYTHFNHSSYEYNYIALG